MQTSTEPTTNRAATAAARAQLMLQRTELQDSMRPVEVGDAELRAGLAQIRTTLADVRGRATKLLSLLGR